MSPPRCSYIYEQGKKKKKGQKKENCTENLSVGWVVARIYEPGAEGEFLFLFWLKKGRGRVGKLRFDIFLPLFSFHLVPLILVI